MRPCNNGRTVLMAKIISIVNQKGGVGKTTSAVNLAAALGALGKRVLLVDIDPQGNTTSGYGISRKNLAATSYEILIGSASAASSVIKTKFQGVDIITSNINLAGAELELVDMTRRESKLKILLLLSRTALITFFLTVRRHSVL